MCIYTACVCVVLRRVYISSSRNDSVSTGACVQLHMCTNREHVHVSVYCKGLNGFASGTLPHAYNGVLQ